MAQPNGWTGVTAEQRFWPYVTKGECWQWIGSQNSTGYGQFWFEGKIRLAHRVSYRMFRGPIPEGLTLDHLCRNRLCVRPEHLEPVTMRVNILRGESRSAIHARKTHCHKGHPFDGDNLIRTEGRRQCRTCRDETYRLRNEARRKVNADRCRTLTALDELEERAT